MATSHINSHASEKNQTQSVVTQKGNYSCSLRCDYHVLLYYTINTKEKILHLITKNVITKASHKCEPSRNRAGNPAFWLISRIIARTSRITGFISKIKKSLKIAIIVPVRRHFVRIHCTETFCSKKNQ